MTLEATQKYFEGLRKLRETPYPSDGDTLDGYLQRAAWSRIGQAYGLFLTNMFHEPRPDVQRAWEDAILAKAEAILTERQKP